MSQSDELHGKAFQLTMTKPQCVCKNPEGNSWNSRLPLSNPCMTSSALESVDLLGGKSASVSLEFAYNGIASTGRISTTFETVCNFLDGKRQRYGPWDSKERTACLWVNWSNHETWSSHVKKNGVHPSPCFRRKPWLLPWFFCKAWGKPCPEYCLETLVLGVKWGWHYSFLLPLVSLYTIWSILQYMYGRLNTIVLMTVGTVGTVIPFLLHAL